MNQAIRVYQNPHLDSPVFFARDEASARWAADQLAQGGEYDFATGLYRGPGGNFRVGSHGIRSNVVLDVSKERADAMQRTNLSIVIEKLELDVRNAWYDENTALSDDDIEGAQEAGDRAEALEARLATARARMEKLS